MGSSHMARFGVGFFGRRGRESLPPTGLGLVLVDRRQSSISFYYPTALPISRKLSIVLSTFKTDLKPRARKIELKL